MSYKQYNLNSKQGW